MSPRAIAVAHWIGCSLWVACACAPESRSAESASSPPDRAEVAPPVCSASEVARYPLRLDGGTQLYVEPQALHRAGAGFLVAGSPTYEWSVVPGRGGTSVGENRILGAFVEDGRATTLPRPSEVGHVGAIRLIRRPEGVWSWLLAEFTESFAARGELVRIWYAESVGSRWSSIEELPAPSDATPNFFASSSLVTAAGGLAWAVPVALEGGRDAVLLYERSAATWAYEPALDTKAEVALLLSSEARGMRLGIVGPDPELGLLPSLRLYEAAPGWTVTQRIAVQLAGEAIRQPQLIEVEDGIAATWIVQSSGAPLSAWSASGLRGPEPPPPHLLDRSAVQSVGLALPRGPTLWIVDHQNEISGAKELRIYRRAADGPELIGSIASPYLGYFTTLADSESEFLIIGPEYDPTADQPFVRSLVIRLSVLCT